MDAMVMCVYVFASCEFVHEKRTIELIEEGRVWPAFCFFFGLSTCALKSFKKRKEEGEMLEKAVV